MDQGNNHINRIKNLIVKLKDKLDLDDSVVAFILYGSFSDKSDHQPTKYSDLDVEIIVKDEEYQNFLKGFRNWFETNFEPVLIETKLGHLQKIFVTNDFLDLQFHISAVKEFDEIDQRPLNYFPNGYTILFDKSGLIENKISVSLKKNNEQSPQEAFDALNNSFWYFVQGTSPYIERKEYWFGASGYWTWLYPLLCKLLRIYFKKEVAENNPLKHLERDLPIEIVQRISPLKNLETEQDLKSGMQLLIDIYSEFACKISSEQNLQYDSNIENKVKAQVKPYLEID